MHAFVALVGHFIAPALAFLIVFAIGGSKAMAAKKAPSGKGSGKPGQKGSSSGEGAIKSESAATPADKAEAAPSNIKPAPSDAAAESSGKAIDQPAPKAPGQAAEIEAKAEEPPVKLSDEPKDAAPASAPDKPVDAAQPEAPGEPTGATPASAPEEPEEEAPPEISEDVPLDQLELDLRDYLFDTRSKQINPRTFRDETGVSWRIDPKPTMIGALEGQVNCMLHVARMFQHGWLLNPDSQLAMGWFKRAADTGDPEAVSEYARKVLSGLLNPKNPRRALEILLARAEAGEVPPMADIWLIYKEDDTLVERKVAFGFLKKAAEAGYPRAQHALSLVYLGGDPGIPKSPSLRQAWLSRAAKQGYQPAVLETKGISQPFRRP